MRLYDDVRGGRTSAPRCAEPRRRRGRADRALAGPPVDLAGDTGGRVTRAPDGPSRWCSRASPCFVVLAVLLVPWDPVPGGALSAPRPVVAVHRRRDRACRGLRPVGAGLGLVLAGGVAAGRSASWASPAPGARWSAGCPARGGCRSPSPSPASGHRAAGDPAVRGRAAPARARLRAVEPGLGGVRRRPGQGRGRWTSWSPRSSCSCWSAAPAAGRGPGPPSPAWCSACWCWWARSSTRCSWSRCSTTSRRWRRARCAPGSSTLADARASRSTTCWSPTRRGVRRR